MVQMYLRPWNNVSAYLPKRSTPIVFSLLNRGFSKQCTYTLCMLLVGTTIGAGGGSGSFDSSGIDRGVQ